MSAFHCECPAYGQQVFDPLRCLVTTMRQESVITHTDPQARGNPPEHDCYYQRLPIEHKKCRHRAHMEQGHENRSVPVDTVCLLLRRCFADHFESSISSAQPIPAVHRLV